MFQKIVLALDGSDAAEGILPYAEELARKFGASITLVRATTSVAELMSVASAGGIDVPAVIDPTPMIESERDDAANYLQPIVDRLRDLGLKAVCEYPEGPAPDAIVDQADKVGADLIAMTSHGHSGLEHVLFGSVAEGVLHRARCPVLVVRVKDVG